jgi:Transposase IS116/IS110/IS902 family.
LRGVGLIAAVTFMVEVGNMRRFEPSRQLMAYLGFVPSERTIDDTVRRSGISSVEQSNVRREDHRHDARCKTLIWSKSILARSTALAAMIDHMA